MKVLLIVSRVLGVIVAFFFLFIATSEIIDKALQGELIKGFNLKDYLFFEIVFVSSIAYVLSWRHEGLGGLIMTICGVAISYFSDWKLGVPFFIIGQLYVLYWFLLTSRKKKTVV
jgi:hypothetical protein